MKKSTLHPESLMMTYGYKPELSEGAVKPPIFQTSTFAFKSAEEGKAFFEIAYGIRDKNEGEELGLIYSRINNPKSMAFAILFKSGIGAVYFWLNIDNICFLSF